MKIDDKLIIGGASLVVIGIAMISTAASVIAAGLILTAAGLMWDRITAPDPKREETN